MQLILADLCGRTMATCKPGSGTPRQVLLAT